MEKTLEKNKEHGKASIVLLIGPSSAGKSTICEELLKQNQSLPEKERLNWQVWGQDLEMDSFFKEAYEKCSKLFGEDKRFKTVADCNIPNRNIIIGIGNGTFHDHKTGESLSLLDREKFNSSTDDFIKKTDGRYSKEMLDGFQSLVQERRQELLNAHPSVNINEKMFDQAIENSRNGKPTILDLVPGGKENRVEEFEKHLEKRNFSCPTHVALVHLPFKDLIDRVSERNRKAKESGDLDNQRDGVFPFDQYSTIFGAGNDKNSRKVGEKLLREDVVKAVKNFANDDKGGKIRNMNSPERTKMANDKAGDLLNKLGFKENEDSIEILTKTSFDALYDITKVESTTEVAKRIQALATQTSIFPDKPNPIIGEYKNILESLNQEPNTSVKASDVKKLVTERAKDLTK